MQSITNAIDAIDAHFRKTEISDETRLLQRVVKLNEEVGELCEAVLYESDPNQRDKHKEINFAGELADVTICLLMLAKGKNINLWEAVETELEKITQRLKI